MKRVYLERDIQSWYSLFKLLCKLELTSMMYTYNNYIFINNIAAIRDRINNGSSGI